MGKGLLRVSTGQVALAGLPVFYAGLRMSDFEYSGSG